jgi:hypothetical protein
MQQQNPHQVEVLRDYLQTYQGRYLLECLLLTIELDTSSTSVSLYRRILTQQLVVHVDPTGLFSWTSVGPWRHGLGRPGRFDPSGAVKTVRLVTVFVVKAGQNQQESNAVEGSPFQGNRKISRSSYRIKGHGHSSESHSNHRAKK